MELVAGLRSSEVAENRGDPGEPIRDRAVMVAVVLKNR
jgi:hypothetical protein